MKKEICLLVLAIALLALASCKSSLKSEESVSNINNALQDSVEVILEKHLVEYGAMDGVAIIMETESGKIRAMVGLEAKDDSAYVRADSLAASNSIILIQLNFRVQMEFKKSYLSKKQRAQKPIIC